jgi:predicted TIM-barrel fold metal-dependent hydrolase
MADLSISTSILSLTAPGCTILQGPAAAKLARAVNEHAASIRDSSPSAFGFFAALPPLLDSLDATLTEIAYALDVLHADGITLYTRYGPGNRYLGHPDFIPIWAALSARSAVVFIHPTHLADTNLVNPSLPQPMIDYPHETTRAAVDLIMSNRLREHPGCRIILSHAGGTLPYLATRAAYMLPDYGLSAKPAEEFLEDARSFYYDLALSSNQYTLDLLLQFAAPGRILFGTDFPYAPRKTIGTLAGMWDGYAVDEGQRMRMDRGNALGLFPRLGKEGGGGGEEIDGAGG